jgi:hypothetical protein
MDGIVPICIKNPKEVGKNSLPNTKFKFMKKVRDK